MKNFINLADIDKQDLRSIIDDAKLKKKNIKSKKISYKSKNIFDGQNFNYDF